MSRSRKKIPKLSDCSKWIDSKRKASKRSCRHSIKNLILKENWDLIPKIRNDKNQSFLYYYNYKYFNNKSDFRDIALKNIKLCKEASDKNYYLFLIKEGMPFDYIREWKGYYHSGISKKSNKDYYDTYSKIYDDISHWFPIFNSMPFNMKEIDEKYIEMTYLRK